MRLFLIAFGVFVIGLPLLASPFENIDSIQERLGFEPYYQTSARRALPLRVAILDKGFFGYKAEIGRTLPYSTTYHSGPIEAPENVEVTHGLVMAQIFSALATDEGRWNPEIDLHLYNVFGFSNFQAAIDDLINKQVDIVLYSEVWEYGGNHDGQGFINAEVSRATQAGILWVNAAGNFGEHTFNSAIKTGAEDWVTLPDRNQALEFRCDPVEGRNTCPLRVVLNWNDFKNSTEPGTNKDLDLALTDDLLNILETAALKQSADPDEERPGYSKYPREILVKEDLSPGTYYLRVKDRSRNFTSSDQLRIVVGGEFVSLTTYDRYESLLNPADHPSVITVGASDSQRTSRSRLLGKPDVFAPSLIRIKEGGEYKGTSNSAAIVAAGIALMKMGGYEDLTREQAIRYLEGAGQAPRWR